MAGLEELTRGAAVKGILPDGLVTVVDVKWHGTAVVELTDKDAAGRLGSELLYRDREPTLAIVAGGRPWSFDGDGRLFRLVSERPIASAWPISSTRSWRSILRWSIRCPTRSPPSTARCSPASRCGSSSPTILAPANSLDATMVQRVRQGMERAEARRLQPHFIARFVVEAFRLLGGTIREHEPRRYAITHVPAAIRSRDRQIGAGEPVYLRRPFQREPDFAVTSVTYNLAELVRSAEVLR